MDVEPWTIDELSTRLARALADGRSGQVNGRIRQIPDRRTIRYYTTIGLVDRPTAMRGRTALYGPRHLLQLVAIKKLQARGLALADVQRHLLGATDATLAQLADLPPTRTAAPADATDIARAVGTRSPASPAGAVAGSPVPGEASTTTTRRAVTTALRTDRPAAAAAAGVAEATPGAASAAGRFWLTRPVAAAPAVHPAPADPQAPPSPPPAPGIAPTRSVVPTRPDVQIRPVPAIRIGAQALLTLPGAGRALEPADLVAIAEAVAPLLEELRRRGLDHHEGTPA
jgi:DNA-binding transcriptional MerR regulator